MSPWGSLLKTWFQSCSVLNTFGAPPQASFFAIAAVFPIKALSAQDVLKSWDGIKTAYTWNIDIGALPRQG